MPDRLLAGGFVFRQPDITAALRHVVGSQETAS